MKTIEARALSFIALYEKKTGMIHIDKSSLLLNMMADALKEQDKITRHACAEAILTTDTYQQSSETIKTTMHKACMSVTQK